MTGLTRIIIPMSNPERPTGVTLLSLFLTFGALMACLAATMLLFPGSFLEPLWRLNPRAHEGFVTLGIWSVLVMGEVSAGCAAAAIGLWRCARWGYIAAVVILSINLLGDTMNALIANDWRTLIGLPIGGAMLVYLLKKRRVFRIEQPG